MQQIYLANPRKRRKARRKASSSRRKASPAQLRARARFAAMARSRSGSRKRRASPRRRVRRNPIAANPVQRRYRRRVARRASGGARRRVRRNPIAVRGLLNQAIGYAKDAAVGAGGAIAVDVAMAQALKLMPDTFSAKVASRSTMEGGVNWGYYAVKSGLAVALGALAGKFLPGMRRYAAVGVQGSFMVQGYEIARAVLPPEMLTLGYYSPAAVAAVPGPNGRANLPVRSARSVGYYPRRALAGVGSQSRPGMNIMSGKVGHNVIGG